MLSLLNNFNLSDIPIAVLVGVSFLISALVAFLILPPIIETARRNRILDTPNARTSHSVPTPRLGGIAIFFSLLISLAITDELATSLHFQASMYAGIFIIFLTGILDDFSHLDARKKLTGQLLVTGIIIFGMDISIDYLYGFAGLESLPAWASVSLSALVIIVIINAFNLIDGINGLSGSMTVLAGLIFGIWFYLVGAYLYSLLAFALVGASCSFLYFNWSPSKIFLGDSGSLLNGTIVSILVVAFLHLHHNLPEGVIWKVDAAPAVVICILMVPLFDTFRVFLIRIFSGKSPLSPDRNHIHHILIDAGYTHSQSTLMLVILNLAFVLTAFGLNFIGGIALYVLITLMLLLIASLFAYIRVRNRQRV